MASTNLDISISASTDKARAELELLKGKLSETNKELRNLRTEGAKRGDMVPSAQLQAASARANALTTSIQSLNKSLVQTGNTMDWMATKPMRRLLTQFGNMERTAKNLGIVIGGTFGGIAGGILFQGAFNAVQSLVDAIGEAHKRLVALRDDAAKTGQAPATIEAARRISERAGRPREDADKMLTTVSDAFRAVRTEAGAAIGPVNTLRGNVDDAAQAAKNAAKEIATGVNVMHGARTATFDVAQAYDLVGVNLKKYTDNEQGQKQATLDTIKGLVRLSEQGRLTASQLDAVSKKTLGLPAVTVLEQATDQIKQLNDEIAKLGKLQERLDLSKALEIARNKQKQSTEDFFADINEIFNRLELRLLKYANETQPQNFQQSFENFKKALGILGRDIENLLRPILDPVWAAWRSGLDAIGRYFVDKFNWIMRQAAAAANAVAQLGSGRVVAEAPIPPPNSDDMGFFAAGGRVRGPGTGTSDSILARLSNGEFVMRAAAVAHWGPRFMAALNNLRNPFGSFAAGGLVRPMRSFATGGLVSAMGTTDGATVHLHLDGRAFPMRADNDVADSLIRTARAKQMLSAGRKPGWAGGRRYGG